ncbi:MAG: hypothetical protein FJ164_12730 [Gammaproteobacteria bacterium]|nr:hypothetical protein [Gammaproteobacteria bacterium]
MRKTSLIMPAALAAIALGFGSQTIAADGTVTAEQEQAMQQATRAPHKVANRYHNRYGAEEKAQFARVEIAPDAATGPTRRPHKGGNQFSGTR